MKSATSEQEPAHELTEAEGGRRGKGIAAVDPVERDAAAKRILEGEAASGGALVEGEGAKAPLPAPNPVWNPQAETIAKAALRTVARLVFALLGSFKVARSIARSIEKEVPGAAAGASKALGPMLGYSFPNALPWVAMGAGIVNGALEANPLPTEEQIAQAREEKKRTTDNPAEALR